jgi:hypothetical protein
VTRAAPQRPAAESVPSPAVSAPSRAPAAAPPPLPVTPPSTSAARPPAQGSTTPTPPRPGAGARAPINPFLANDPNQKAKRLARALISDIIAYHPDKHAESQRAGTGTLKELFREEIKKSYEEYVDQMGREFAEAPTHWY